MEKPLMCLDLSDGSAKVLIGYNVGGEPVVAFSDEHNIDGAIKGGVVSDPERLIEIVSSFHEVSDPSTKFSVSVSSGICLLLPPIGLKVYALDQTTNVVSETSEISKTDITNLMSMASKFSLPDPHTAIVDIIPDEFILESGERYANPPLGKVSRRLGMKAKIFVMPESVLNAYKRVLNQAGMRPLRIGLTPYCQAELFKTYPNLPTSYLLVDIGAKLTSVSLIGDGSCYASTSFLLGGDDLTGEIAEAFQIEFSYAENLKKDYGYDTREKKLNPPLLPGQSELTQSELNQIIEAHFERLDAMLHNAISTILMSYGGKLNELPIIFTGGGSSLYGISSLFAKTFRERALFFPEIRSIGARERGFSPSLGMILTASRYNGSLEDNLRGVTSLTRPRVEKDDTKTIRSSRPDIDNL